MSWGALFGVGLGALATERGIAGRNQQTQAAAQAASEDISFANAELELRDAERERNMAKLRGQQLARLGLAGVEATGTAEDVIADSAAENARAGWADAFRVQANNQRRRTNVATAAQNASYSNLGSVLSFGANAFRRT